MDPRFYQKIEIFQNTKFQQNSIVYYFFFIFFSIIGILFSISPIQTFPKIMEFFVVFYWKGYRFYEGFLENSKSCFKQIIDM